MRTNPGPNTNNRYEEILASTNSYEVRLRYIKEAKFLAFYEHLLKLGEVQDRSVDLIKGKTELSIPGYFKLEGFRKNPINNIALGILPKITTTKEYAGHEQDHVDDKALEMALNIPVDFVGAARAGYGEYWAVASELGLLDSQVRESHSINDAWNNKWADVDPHLYDIKNLVKDVPRDLNENIIGEIAVIAGMADKKGYVDFLDYLLDAKSTIDYRITTIFSEEANPIPDKQF